MKLIRDRDQPMTYLDSRRPSDINSKVPTGSHWDERDDCRGGKRTIVQIHGKVTVPHTGVTPGMRKFPKNRGRRVYKIEAAVPGVRPFTSLLIYPPFTRSRANPWP